MDRAAEIVDPRKWSGNGDLSRSTDKSSPLDVHFTHSWQPVYIISSLGMAKPTQPRTAQDLINPHETLLLPEVHTSLPVAQSDFTYSSYHRIFHPFKLFSVIGLYRLSFITIASYTSLFNFKGMACDVRKDANS